MATADQVRIPSIVESASAQRLMGEDSRAAPLMVEIWPDLANVAALWRRLEGSGTCSPYQRLDWVESYASALCAPRGLRTCVVSFRHGTSEPILLLPLAVHVHRGVRIASPIGGKQANYHCPVMAPGAAAALDAETVRKLLCEAGVRAGIDVFVLRNMPLAWRGEGNPLALPGALPSPSNVPRTALSADAKTMLAQTGSSEARRKLRRKEAGLAAMGALTHVVAQNAGDVDRILGAFFRQKNDRFRELGITSPFDDASRDFLRAACLAGLDRGGPAIELHGLALDGRIIATYGGAVDEERFSCMINSFDLSPDVARFSPGDILLTRVVASQCDRGRRSLDLGVGEARYKRLVCKDVEELVDVVLPVTALGRLYGLALEPLVTAKRTIKRTASLWSLVQVLRAARARLGLV